MERNSIYILGLNLELDRDQINETYLFRDKASCLIQDGHVISALDAMNLPDNQDSQTDLPTAHFILNDLGIKMSEVDKIAIFGLEKNDSRDLRNQLLEIFRETFNINIDKHNLFFVKKHFAYAKYASTLSGFDECLFLTMNKTNESFYFMILNGVGEALSILKSFFRDNKEEFIYENIVDDLAYYRKELATSKLCIAGNKLPPPALEDKIVSAGIFEDIFALPAENAVNCALGAALYLYCTVEAEHRQSMPEYEIHRNETERILIEIWGDVLSKENIGINDDFFELGGNSLKALELENRIQKELKSELPLQEIFRRPTVKELASYIKDSEKINHSDIKQAELKSYYQMTSTQKRMFILYELEGSSTNYNLMAVFMIEGLLDIDRFDATVKKLIKRHESLRTVFRRVNGEPIQQIKSGTDFTVEYFQVKGLDSDSKVEELLESFIRPFDLTEEVFRVGLIKGEAGESAHLLMVDMHHIIADGISQDILIKDFVALYREEALPELRIQFKDYIEWQNSPDNLNHRKKQEAFWIDEFKGEIPELDLPTDFQRPPEHSFEGSHLSFELDQEKTARLRIFAKEENVSLYILIMCVFNVLLSKLSLQEDIVVGTDVAGRRHADLEKVIGMFVNTLAIRNYPQGDKTFKEFLGEVKDKTFQAFENQDYLYADLVDKVIAKRDLGRNPLFDVMFSYQNIDVYTEKVREIEASGFKLRFMEYETGSAKFDLLLTAYERGSIFFFLVEYRTRLFKEAKIQKYIDFFQEILDCVLDDRDLKLKDIPAKNHRLEAEPGNFSMDFGF